MILYHRFISLLAKREEVAEKAQKALKKSRSNACPLNIALARDGRKWFYYRHEADVIFFSRRQASCCWFLFLFRRLLTLRNSHLRSVFIYDSEWVVTMRLEKSDRPAVAARTRTDENLYLFFAGKEARSSRGIIFLHIWWKPLLCGLSIAQMFP